MFLGNLEPGAYTLPDEIVVRRRVLVMGHPVAIPNIDASNAVRGFHVVVSWSTLFPSWSFCDVCGSQVRRSIDLYSITTPSFKQQEGGFLELRFVRLRQGGGIVRDRYGLEGAGLRTKVCSRV